MIECVQKEIKVVKPGEPIDLNGILRPSGPIIGPDGSRWFQDADGQGWTEENQEQRREQISEDIKTIKELPSTEPRWILISERLPNHDECIKNNRLFNVSDGNRSYSEWFDYDKQRFGEHTMAGFRIDYAVTAWMPLPAPYQEGEHE